MTSNNEPTFLDMNDLCDQSLEALIQHYLSVNQKLPDSVSVRERLLELEREQFNREREQQEETNDNWRGIYTYDNDDTILYSTGSNNLYSVDVPWLSDERNFITTERHDWRINVPHLMEWVWRQAWSQPQILSTLPVLTTAVRGRNTEIRRMNGVNYDSWLNSNNPYDEADEQERERAWILEEIEGLDEDEIEDFLFEHRLDDPRKWTVLCGRTILGSRERHTKRRAW